MSKSNRLFEMIQILRAATRPITADALAERLEVSVRTVYRDIVALQAMRTPVEGEPGVGYVMRRGYDLPPLNFDEEEIEALRVGLSMLTRAGDTTLSRAAERICAKIDALQAPADWLQVSPWGAPADDPTLGCVSIAELRAAVREERKLCIEYQDGEGGVTSRTVRPIALVYHINCVLLAGWCEMRGGFRHFRADRIHACRQLEETFPGQGDALRSIWRESNRWDREDLDAPEGATAPLIEA